MKTVLEAKNIELVVKSRAVPILKNINLTFYSGEFVVILGHNGSGKSSLVKILSGEKKPSLGQVFMGGERLVDIPNKIRAQQIITITQNPHDRLFLELTLKENMIMWEDRFKYKNSRNFSGYDNKIFKHQSFQNDVLVSSLSGGEKQSFLLSLVLKHPPRVLFLDEHTSALDPKAAIEVMNITNQSVKTNKITTIMVTHRLEDAIKYGDRIIIMKEGIVTYDSPKRSDLSVSTLQNMME